MRDDPFWHWFRSDRFKACGSAFYHPRMVELHATFSAGMRVGKAKERAKKRKDRETT